MMRKHLRKRRNVTLIEMMIVMFLIALITGVVAYNYTGSLDKGKAFKTEQAMNRVENVLNLKMAEDPGFVISDWKNAVTNSPLIQNPSSFLVDGWGQEFKVNADNGIISITSDKYEEYKKKHP